MLLNFHQETHHLYRVALAAEDFDRIKRSANLFRSNFESSISRHHKCYDPSKLVRL
jgi:hypothetical protein